MDRQAEMLARLRSITRSEFQQAQSRLQAMQAEKIGAGRCDGTGFSFSLSAWRAVRQLSGPEKLLAGGDERYRRNDRAQSRGNESFVALFFGALTRIRLRPERRLSISGLPIARTHSTRSHHAHVCRYFTAGSVHILSSCCR